MRIIPANWKGRGNETRKWSEEHGTATGTAGRRKLAGEKAGHPGCALSEKLTEMQTGPPVPFADLGWSEQADVLREFIHWDRYPERAWDDEYRIRENIADGKPPEQWLENTSLGQSFRLLEDGITPPPAKQCPEITWDDVKDALAKAGADQSPAKADDGKISLRDLKNGTQEREKREEHPKAKAHDIER